MAHLGVQLVAILAIAGHFGWAQQQAGASSNATASPPSQQQQVAAARSEATDWPSESYKIDASGWPSTSPLWPSLNTAAETGAISPSNATIVTEPFIYVDQPRSADYGLLLKTNQTSLEQIKLRAGNHSVSLNLSFEFYFNHEPKLAALPGIKVEIERHEFKYLQPDSRPIKPGVWCNFSEQIAIENGQNKLQEPDWLRLVLVNRKSRSIVAIRHIRAELVFDAAGSAAPSSGGAKPADSPQKASKGKTATKQEVIETDADTDKESPSDESAPGDDKEAKMKSHDEPATPHGAEKSTKGWGGLGKRRKRDTGDTSGAPVVFTCLKETECDWRSEADQGQLQWSLGRMPPSTERVQLGYYHVSIQPKYGDPSKTLYLSLNRTESATSRDDNSDHCLELAIYITESTYLNMYSFKRELANANAWQRGNLLLSWAPTVGLQLGQQASGKLTPEPRQSLAGNIYRGASSSGGVGGGGGWTFETLCFGDFFDLSLDSCGFGGSKCAFGFEMQSDFLSSLRRSDDATGGPSGGPAGGSSGRQEPPSNANDMQQAALERQQAAVFEELASLEQVVAVGLTRAYATNKPIKLNKSQWLQSWRRDEVQPSDDWRFYPGMDFIQGANYVQMTNLYHEAHYHIVSDWLVANLNLDFGATLLISNNELKKQQQPQPDLKAQQVAGAQGQQQEQSPARQTIDLDEKPALQLNELEQELDQQQQHKLESDNLFKLKLTIRLVDVNFATVHSENATINWPATRNSSQVDLSFSASDRLTSITHKLDSKSHDRLFKVILELGLECAEPAAGKLAGAATDRQAGGQPPTGEGSPLASDTEPGWQIVLANVSLSDRCYPSPCRYGKCSQLGTEHQDWQCQCDEKHRGRSCELGNWCQLAHVAAWTAKQQQQQQQQQQVAKQAGPTSIVVIKTPPSELARRPKIIERRYTGAEYCKQKLGPGSSCLNIDLALNDNLYEDEDVTFSCACQDNFYLSDEAKCKEAHQCNSIVCPQLGSFCDDTKPFDRSRPCRCNQAQGWHPDPSDASGNRCTRQQCLDIKHDCQFNAHICIPTLPGERPICKCGPKFVLKLIDEKSGTKQCQSAACVLPTLNDCEQLCEPDNDNPGRPYRCACHPGWTLNDDGRSCRPANGLAPPVCYPSCAKDNTQICTKLGCKCKQGHVAEAPKVFELVDRNKPLIEGQRPDEYTSSVKCLNVCQLSYAENKLEFDKIESVCPLGLCNAQDFTCKCFDSASAALINSKYERSSSEQTSGTTLESPLCRLKRVCEPNSLGARTCQNQGAICVPDYTKASMFDCTCPPGTEKRQLAGAGNPLEFRCESKCSVSKSDCLRRMAVCRLTDRDQTKCDCLPGFMANTADQKCYLARFTYAFNLIVVNKYYQPMEAVYRRLVTARAGVETVGNNNTVNGNDLLLFASAATGGGGQPPDDITATTKTTDQQLSKRNKLDALKFIAVYNQCNISQVIPKQVIDDPYEHDLQFYLTYLEQCNEKIHQNVKSHQLSARLREEVRQTLRQHLKDFSVTTGQELASCQELDPAAGKLNCSLYLQANEPISEQQLELILNKCDEHSQASGFCWVKPRLLLTISDQQVLNFRQVIPCALNNFCGSDAYSVRMDDKSSLCSCKCANGVEPYDAKQLEFRENPDEPARTAIKEICAPIDLCQANSTFCESKPNSRCAYEFRTGSRCLCAAAYYELDGRCVEQTLPFVQGYIVVVVAILGLLLLVSLVCNFLAAKRLNGGRSKHYQLDEFKPPPQRRANRSTGVPNPAFNHDNN